MLQVSDDATAELRSKLDEVPADVGYRLLISEDKSYRLRLDRPSQRDRVVSTDDHVILMLDSSLDRQMVGIRLERRGEERLALAPVESAPGEADS